LWKKKKKSAGTKLKGMAILWGKKNRTGEEFGQRKRRGMEKPFTAVHGREKRRKTKQ